MKVALVYDRLNKIGGAERVLCEFHTLYPDADWYTSVWDPGYAPFSTSWRVRASWLNTIPILRRHHEWIPFLMPYVFESFDFSGYDLVISIGSAESKGVITPPRTCHIHYCLTPTRYLWSHTEEYLDDLPFVLRPLAGAVMKKMRAWDAVAAQRPDYMISISKHVKKRVKKYYMRDTDVLYPPVDVGRFAVSAPDEMGEYYLVVSRLVPYKNIDLVIRSFNANGRPLRIIGTGSESARLKKLARSNIEFIGAVADSELPEQYAHCRAYIQANEEDFGISMVESLAADRPVIAYNSGGAAEIVTGKSGVLYNNLSVDHLNSAIAHYERVQIMRGVCRDQAAKFDSTVWRKEMKKRIITVCRKHKKIYG